MARAIPASQIVRIIPGIPGAQPGGTTVTPTPTPTPTPGSTTGTANATTMASAASTASKLAAGSASATAAASAPGGSLRAAIGAALASTSAQAIAAATASVGSAAAISAAQAAGVAAKRAAAAAAAVSVADGQAAVGNYQMPATWAGFKSALAAGTYATNDCVDTRYCTGVPATDDLSFAKTYALPGLVVILNPNVWLRIAFDARTHNIRFFGGKVSADRVAGTIGNGGTSPTWFGVAATNANGISFEGTTFDGNANGFHSNGSTGVTLRNCLFRRFRDNGFILSSFYSQIKQFSINDNTFVESLYYPQTWYSKTGADPVFNAAPVGTYEYIDPNHIDAGQFFFDTLGPFQDSEVLRNTLSGRMQGFFFSDGANLRLNVSSNTIATTGSWPIQVDQASDITCIANNVSVFSDPNPGTASQSVGLFSAGGTGKLWGGQCTFGAGVTQNVGGYSINLTSGTLNGTLAALPVSPGYAGFTPNLPGVNVAALTAPPTYTPYSGPVVPWSDSRPKIYISGDQPATSGAINDWMFGAPPLVEGYYFGIESVYWGRWRNVTTGTLVKAATQGPSGMKYQATSGAIYRFEWSADNVTYYNSDPVPIGSVGVGSATATTTASGIAPSGSPATTLSTTDKSSRITVSGTDLVGTVNAGADGFFEGRSVGVAPGAIGNYYFEFKPTQISGSTALAALSNSGWSNLDKDPGNFWFGKALALLTTGFSSADTGSIPTVPLGTGGDVANGSNWFGLYIKRTGSGGSTIKMFIRMPSGWTTVGGDPNAGGVGHDISFFGTDAIYAMTYGQKAGDTQTFNFGASGFVYSVGTTTNFQ